MRIILMFSVLLSYSITSWAQVDYTYCSQFVDVTNANVQKTGFGLPFKLDPKTGEIETINHVMSYQGEKKGEHVYSSSGYAGSIKIVVKKNGTNSIGSIEVDKVTTSPGAPPKIQTVINFDVKNGKCIPSIAHNYADINGKVFKSTIFDSKLCRSLKDYFASNSEMNKCFDPESKENQAMNSLLEKNGYDSKKLINKWAQFTPVLNRYPYSVEQKVITGTSDSFDVGSNSDKENKNVLGMLGGSPLISGHMILSDCYEKGLEQMLSDDSLWVSKSAEPKKGTEAVPK